MRAAARTDLGRCREINEDSVLFDPALGLLIVADGMGGHLAGEVASALAVETIAAYLREALAERNGGPGPDDIPSLLTGGVERAHEAILAKAAGEASLEGMGTTVVLAFSQPGALHIAHVGDSRAYMLEARNSSLRQLTRDHSLVAQMVDAGQITPKEARSHRLRNYLMRSLGSKGALDVDVEAGPWGRGDCLLLCSDGLTSMVDDHGIEKLVARYANDLDRGCLELVKAANSKGGKDNISVILACPE
jgi:serine/threonine protein phosphatase PrpC